MAEFIVTVRELAAFCHRSGDIDHRFSPAPTAAQGVAGHQALYRRRPASYRREYPVEYRHEEGALALLLRGRADGYDAGAALVEEIKTCRVQAGTVPEAVSRLHLAQARLYAAIIARQEGLARVEVRLTWFDIDSGEEHSLSESRDGDELEEFLRSSLQRFSRWLQTLTALRGERDSSLAALPFPYGEFRPGQREIAELVYRCIDRGGQLLVEAPTGIGKTAAVLYPALKALAAGRHDRIVFATAKSVGRRAAEETLAACRRAGMCGPALSLSAKEKICFSPGKACHGDDCPFARGYYDRLPEALEAAARAPALRRREIEALARRFEVCPYYLALDLLPWVDLVIADLHYLYSLGATLGALMDQDGRRWTALLDEVHNLPERARRMYRATLAKAELMRARALAPAPVASALSGINRVLLELQRGEWQAAGHHSQAELPGALLGALQRFVAAVGEQLAVRAGFLQGQPPLMAFYFEVLQFLRVAEQWGDDFRFELSRGGGRQSLRISLNCLDPSRLLQRRQARLHAVTAFSATLSPLHWSRALLGLGEQAVCRQMNSPFAAAQLRVSLALGVDTRYRRRQESMPRLAALIAGWLRRVPGNCIVYFPSYAYLQDCLALLQGEAALPGGRHLWRQAPGQGEDARTGLLSLLETRRDVAAFAILGGVFGEGIDLPGEQLASVVVVGVGLPQVNRDTEQLRAWFEARYGAGFEYAYLYPGMQKVGQALGRVVRTMDDRGRALLIDARFGRRDYRALLPPWWQYSPERAAK
jgi:DNA excision repair protein ERCC-2